MLVFGSFHGDAYRGNTRALFEHFIKDKRFDVVWLTRNPDVVKNLQAQFGTKFVALLHSSTGLKLIRDATMVLYTHGISDFPFVFIPKRVKQFHTYHGLPTKRGEYMKTNGSESPPSVLHKMILHYRFSGITYFLSTSPFVSSIFAKRFNLQHSQMVECGFPSLDALITEGICVQKSLPDTSHIVLYAPTYRRRDRTQWFPFEDMDWPDFTRFLEEHKITLVLRAHPNENLNIKPYQLHSHRITECGELPLNTLLRQTDAIITDYSGIYLEGLLLNIPPIFVPYDRHRYERGFPYDYDSVTPGPKAGTYSAFKMAILDALLNDAPSYSDLRNEVKSTFFGVTDGKATERTAMFIERELGAEEAAS